ncbi:FAD-dependent oxidoreductase [Flavobacterium sp. P4023]|uniref:FAD-dependent oxidoreductase n=1 Tax=Flavobacterium flabelliforme TaxID=2816119 RepID=A0ABS5CSC1_9FLAO|nr:FAD-dependent oxidoreductase [Flavobacterium flabelliforme]MBP4141510.1 FAD-dependent oxidoreductase [Flavobacterium flabelliforme]
MSKIKLYCSSLLIVCCSVFFSCSKEIPPEIRVPVNFDNTTGVDKIDKAKEYDVVVYGGTSAGIIAALEVAQSGKTVLLIKPSDTALGGMTTNGLGVTDVLNTEILGGLTRDFYQKIKEYYSNSQNWFLGNASTYRRYSSNGDVMIWFEPKAAQFVLQDLIIKNAIPVLHSERLDLKNGVKKNMLNAITSIKMESGLVIKGKMFIDASYEGDLMAKSGVSYTYGRESNSQYNERVNGVQRLHSWERNELPDGIFIYGLGSLTLAPNGTSDKKIQAYCYRMCLTNVKENRRTIAKPFDYDEDDYKILFEYVKNYAGNYLCDFGPLPNGKTDSNNFGPISTDYVGKNYNYPEGNYAERQRITEEHKRYQIGFMWTLANHPKIPERIREFYKEWGLPKDEFVESDNWPKQLYIREGRRMISDYVMTENNCTGKIVVSQPVTLADYPMDSHIVQRYIDSKGNLKNEGQLMATTPKPYPIDYRSIVPKSTECTNLFVPVCLSASHIAMGSIRMEPVYMALGQVAAIAAVQSLEKGKKTQELSYEVLKTELLRKKMILQ